MNGNDPRSLNHMQKGTSSGLDMHQVPGCVWVGMLLWLLALLGGCVSPPQRSPLRTPDEVRAQLVQLIPPKTPDRAGWAADIQSSFQLLDIPPSTENLCAALAVIAQESTFVADPVVPNLGRIARKDVYWKQPEATR